MMRGDRPRIEWDQLYASTAFRELLSYRKAGRIRTCNLRVMSESEAELWVVSEGQRTRMSRKLVTFANPDDVQPFLESIEQELRLAVGGRADHQTSGAAELTI
jgi:hypothetical protein